MPERQPLIGVFDSGVGGLTVVAALRRRLPGASILYLGDTARLPYGTKSRRTVLRYSQANVDFLERRGVDALVVACNTASAMALDDLVVRAPHWGVLSPGASAAVAAARRHVGVVATESTVRSGAYEEAIRRLDPRLRVTQQACPLLVPLVEEGWEEDEITERGRGPLPRPVAGRGDRHAAARLHPLPDAARGSGAGVRPGRDPGRLRRIDRRAGRAGAPSRGLDPRTRFCRRRGLEGRWRRPPSAACGSEDPRTQCGPAVAAGGRGTRTRWRRGRIGECETLRHRRRSAGSPDLPSGSSASRRPLEWVDVDEPEQTEEGEEGRT